MTATPKFIEMPKLRNTPERPWWKSYVVPTELLWPVVEPELERINEELANDTFEAMERKVGAIEFVCHRVEQLTNGKRSAACVARRINDMKHCRAKVMDADFADAILLALNIRIEDTNLPTFPGSIKNAVEMVRVRRPHLEDEAEIERLGYVLLKYRDKVLYPNGYTPSSASTARARQRRAQKRLAKKAA